MTDYTAYHGNKPVFDEISFRSCCFDHDHDSDRGLYDGNARQA
jgi:hypothetical protein